MYTYIHIALEAADHKTNNEKPINKTITNIFATQMLWIKNLPIQLCTGTHTRTRARTCARTQPATDTLGPGSGFNSF